MPKCALRFIIPMEVKCVTASWRKGGRRLWNGLLYPGSCFAHPNPCSKVSFYDINIVTLAFLGHDFLNSIYIWGHAEEEITIQYTHHMYNHLWYPLIGYMTHWKCQIWMQKSLIQQCLHITHMHVPIFFESLLDCLWYTIWYKFYMYDSYIVLSKEITTKKACICLAQMQFFLKFLSHSLLNPWIQKACCLYHTLNMCTYAFIYVSQNA